MIVPSLLISRFAFNANDMSKDLIIIMEGREGGAGRGIKTGAIGGLGRGEGGGVGEEDEVRTGGIGRGGGRAGGAVVVVVVVVVTVVSGQAGS